MALPPPRALNSLVKCDHIDTKMFALRPWWWGVKPFFTKSFVLYRIVKPFSGAIQNAITELHSCPGSQVMTRNVNVFVAAVGHFIYKIIYIK